MPFFKLTLASLFALLATTSVTAQEITGGSASFFPQNGLAGACGHFNSDSAHICAISLDRYGPVSQPSPLCGRSLTVTNLNNGKTVVVTVADACPTCQNANSLDLSIGAFDAIANRADGLVPISWHFN